MDNLPEFVFAELGCALAGAALVGLNPTRTGSALARDIEYADCQLVLVEPRYAEQLRDAIGSGDRLPRLDRRRTGRRRLARSRHGARRTSTRRSARRGRLRHPADDRLHLRHDQRARRACSTARAAWRCSAGARRSSCASSPPTTSSTAPCRSTTPTPRSSPSRRRCWPAADWRWRAASARARSSPTCAATARRCSTTSATRSPTSWIRRPEPDDADNPLRLAYGNEAPRQYIAAFAERFGCEVIDGYGSSEVGVGFSRTDRRPAAQPRARAGRQDPARGRQRVRRRRASTTAAGC